MPKFHTKFDPPKSPSLTFQKPTITEQSHKRETDINAIIGKYRRTGVLGTGTQVRDMFFGDFSQVTDYHTAQTAIANAKEKFMSLSADVRKAFDNDPGKLLQALNDEAQLDRLIGLGIVKKPDPVVGTPDNPDQPVDQNAPAPPAPKQS